MSLCSLSKETRLPVPDRTERALQSRTECFRPPTHHSSPSRMTTTPPPYVPSTPPRSHSLHQLSPPRSTSLSNRSPRLGQASFDQSVAHGTGSPRLMQPRKLFPDEQSPLDRHEEASSISMSRETSDQDKEGREGTTRPGATRRETFTRPPALTFASGQAMLPNLRYSSTSSIVSQPSPSSPTLSSTSTHREEPPVEPPIKPSLSLLFSLTTRPTLISIVLPAFALSIIGGLIPPYMTQVLGETLQHFTDYTIITSNPEISSPILSSARSTLLNKVRIESVKFASLGAGVLLISTANQALWVIHGERVARCLRLKVFDGLNRKGLDWFDKGMGGQKGEGETEATGDSAAGLMGRFTK